MQLNIVAIDGFRMGWVSKVLAKDTEDFINNYFKTDLDVKNPYDNLDACIYNLRFI